MDILNIDPKTLLIQLLGFGILLIIFRIFLFRPIMNVMETRQKEIRNQYEDAEERRKTAEQFKADYEQRLVNVENEIRSKLNDAVVEGQKMREEIIAEARSQADKVVAKAQDEIQREKQKAMIELKASMANIAIEAAGKLIEEKLDDEAHHRLINKYIDELDEVSH